MIEQKIGNRTTSTSSKRTQMVMFCDFYSEGHSYHECPSMGCSTEQVDYVQGNRPEKKPTRTPGALPSNTEVNPREHVNTVSEIVEEENSAKEETKQLSGGIFKENEGESEESEKKVVASVPSKQKVLFLEVLVRERKHEEMTEFIKIFSQLMLNLPLCEFFLQVLKYAGHLKDTITKKDKLHDTSTHISRGGNKVSVLVQGKIPTKGKERPKKAKEGRQLPSKTKAEFMKWVLVRQSKEEKAKKDLNDRVREDTLES
ncbi:hypothetical protein M9H77_21446 [Catharanthus roseus]|uniref:Uncharacterized protein n=1 Tax=Catharanthus roseus TaxID=4058 RepID=A0ACC0ARP7_CATRO|nr:hypothetical protein M9H77_21446 [Catharanthus roseus]